MQLGSWFRGFVISVFDNSNEIWVVVCAWCDGSSSVPGTAVVTN